MNIIILYLSVWLFVAVVVFLSIASQIMYSTDIESTSTGTKHGKLPSNIFQSPIDDKTWDLSDKRMIVIYVYPGYNTEYVKSLLWDMHNNVCADSSDVAYCMRWQHLPDTVNIFSKFAEQDMVFYLCLLNMIFKKSGMAEVCLDKEQSEKTPTNNSKNMQLINNEDLIIVDKLTYYDKKKEIPGLPSQINIHQQTFDIYENIRTLAV